MSSKLEEKEMKITVDGLEDLLMMLLERTQQHYTIFYHKQRRIYFAMTFMGTWVIIKTSRRYDEPKSKWINYNGVSMKFAKQPEPDMYNFGIVIVESHSLLK